LEASFTVAQKKEKPKGREEKAVISGQTVSLSLIGGKKIPERGGRRTTFETQPGSIWTGIRKGRFREKGGAQRRKKWGRSHLSDPGGEERDATVEMEKGRSTCERCKAGKKSGKEQAIGEKMGLEIATRRQQSPGKNQPRARKVVRSRCTCSSVLKMTPRRDREKREKSGRRGKTEVAFLEKNVMREGKEKNPHGTHEAADRPVTSPRAKERGREVIRAVAALEVPVRG